MLLERKYLKEEKLENVFFLSSVFNTGKGDSVDDIIKYGDIAMVILSGGEAREKLDKLRLDIFYQKVLV